MRKAIAQANTFTISWANKLIVMMKHHVLDTHTHTLAHKHTQTQTHTTLSYFGQTSQCDDVAGCFVCVDDHGGGQHDDDNDDDNGACSCLFFCSRLVE